jgi:class 3 adenylate cyclase/tetratricopeptide (TPR) repeat protein
MNELSVYLPQDRLRALARGETLPDRTSGSALFADISGFTALTEGLREALGSRRGAEELTKHLDAVYTALITQIEKYGGSVIDFAGDAILCWFDEAHGPTAPRATTCAFALQQAMRAFDAVAMPNGATATLSVKVTVASGPARRFVVGDPTIHYIDALAGATVARTSTAEHHAQKGDVLLDEASVSALGEALTIKEWREDHDTQERFAVVTQFAGEAAAPMLPAFVRLPAANKLQIWLQHAVFEHEQAGQESFLTEFRPCAALFVRFSGIDFDADTAQSHLDTFIRSTQTIVERYDGTLMNIVIGDKGSYAHINFGALSVYEDDARRAVKAAFDLKMAAVELGFLAPLQMGLTHGQMRVGAYGGQTRRTYSALGDEVNLAARLMMTASAGEILLSGQVHQAVEPYFVFEPRAPIAMKGKAEPQPVFAVTGERQQRAIRLQEPTYALPMVGRQNELQIINDKLDLSLQGKSQVIGIIAEAGMGKSRLVAEVIRTAHKKGFAGYGGACQSDGINTPYLTWKAIWSAFFSVDPEHPLKKQIRLLEGEIEDRAPSRVQALPLLGVLLNLDIPDNDFTKTLEPKYRLSALRALLEDCLRAAAQAEPLLIVIEDLHWIDALSHDLLEELARALSDSRVCFVLAYRPPQLARLEAPRLEAMSNFTKIELRELNASEVEQVIRAKLAQLYPARGGAVPIGLVDKLMTRSQGNPFYLEELLNFLRDRGLDPREPQALEKIELPDSLHTLILSRLDQLSEREKTTLRVASIVGRLFRVDWLTGYYPELGGLNRAQADLEQLAEIDITPLDSPEPELAYVFKHIVTHEVTYESLPFATRARLHEQLAVYLEGQARRGASLDILVHHYLRTDNHAKQREYLRKAAQAAQDVSAFNTAMEYLARLVELSRDLTDFQDLSDLNLQLAEAHYRLSDFPAARAAIAQAQAAAKTDADRANALALLGEMTSIMGNYADAQKILTEAAPLARGNSDKLILCRTLYALGDVNWRLGKLDEARVALDESLALARALGNLTRELFALNRLGMAALTQGNVAEAERLFAEVHTRATAAGNRERAMAALNNLGEAAKERQDYALARGCYQQSLALARAIGAQSDAALFLINLAAMDTAVGQLSNARAGLREGLTLALRFGALPWVVGAVMYFAKLVYAEGQTERALRLWGLARRHPAWSSDNQHELDTALAEWALDPSVVEAGLAKGAELDWDATIQELLKGG